MGAGAAHATWTESHRGHHPGKAAAGGARLRPPALAWAVVLRAEGGGFGRQRFA